MGSENMGGAWIIFPIVMIPTMLIFMYFMFVRSGGRRPWQQDADGDDREPGPYREPPSHHESGEDLQAGVAERPLDILNRRYAAGEITREEFDQMRQDLAQG